jgi:RNA polymerase sigma factor (sigma-70 family)
MTTAILWDDYKGMAYGLAMRLSRAFYNRIDVDDLVGEASIAFVEATKTFNPEKATQFSTHFQWCMRHRIRNFLYRETRQEKAKKAPPCENQRPQKPAQSHVLIDLSSKGGDFAKLIPFLLEASEDPTVQRPFDKRKEALKKAQEANGWTAKHTKNVFKKAKMFLKESH